MESYHKIKFSVLEVFSFHFCKWILIDCITQGNVSFS